jgi:hypothetical protein
MWKYLPAIATAFLAALQLAKDWGAHQTTWRRAGVLLLILILAAGGAVNTYYSSKNSATQHIEDQQQIAGLQKAVETANKNQQENTAQFVEAFGKLSQRVANLQAAVNTTEITNQANKLKAELEATQKALVPDPKARLVFGFLDENLQGNPPTENSPIHVVQGSPVSVDFAAYNGNDAVALKGLIFVRICLACQFAKGPDGFTHEPKAHPSERVRVFDILPKTTQVPITLNITRRTVLSLSMSHSITRVRTA